MITITIIVQSDFFLIVDVGCCSYHADILNWYNFGGILSHAEILGQLRHSFDKTLQDITPAFVECSNVVFP